VRSVLQLRNKNQLQGNGKNNNDALSSRKQKRKHRKQGNDEDDEDEEDEEEDEEQEGNEEQPEENEDEKDKSDHEVAELNESKNMSKSMGFGSSNGKHADKVVDYYYAFDTGHKDFIRSMVQINGGNNLITASEDKTIKVFTIAF